MDRLRREAFSFWDGTMQMWFSFLTTLDLEFGGWVWNLQQLETLQNEINGSLPNESQMMPSGGRFMYMLYKYLMIWPKNLLPLSKKTFIIPVNYDFLANETKVC